MLNTPTLSERAAAYRASDLFKTYSNGRYYCPRYFTLAIIGRGQHTYRSQVNFPISGVHVHAPDQRSTDMTYRWRRI